MVLDVEDVPLPYKREVGSIMTKILSRHAHRVNVREHAVHFGRKGSSYADVLSHVNYEWNEKVPTGYLL